MVGDRRKAQGLEGEKKTLARVYFCSSTVGSLFVLSGILRHASSTAHSCGLQVFDGSNKQASTTPRWEKRELDAPARRKKQEAQEQQAARGSATAGSAPDFCRAQALLATRPHVPARREKRPRPHEGGRMESSYGANVPRGDSEPETKSRVKRVAGWRRSEQLKG